jgi:2-polyprenyl-3-methyl-5-hydroxy-6-metoxy-1,4-benzoquinol methylase
MNHLNQLDRALPDAGAATRSQYLEFNAARASLARRRPAFTSELRYMRATVPAFPRGRVLDIACGPGVFSEFLAEHGADVWGVDFDHTLAATAHRRLSPDGTRQRFVAARVEQLPYRDGTFDACVADSLLEHVPDWQQTLREAERVLRPGGMLVFYTANRLHPFTREINHFPFYPWLPERLKRVILRYVMAHRPDLVNYTEFPAVNWFTYRQMQRFLTDLGFEVRTRLDLIDASRLRGWKRLAARGLPVLRAVMPLRLLYFIYAPDVSVYAVKLGDAR